MPQLSEDLRRALTNVVATTEDGSLGTALVLSGSGFANSALRALFNSLFLVSGSREPLKVFDSRAAAAEWLAELSQGAGVSWNPADIVAQTQLLEAAAQ